MLLATRSFTTVAATARAWSERRRPTAVPTSTRRSSTVPLSTTGSRACDARFGRGAIALRTSTIARGRKNDEFRRALLQEFRALTEEVRALRTEVGALRAGGTIVAGQSASDGAAKTEASEADMMAMLGLGGGDAGTATAPAGESQSAPLLDVNEWRGDGTDRSSEWPMVKQNEDDIYLMVLIHGKLVDAGFWVGEDDSDDMYFGATTKEALLYFQAQNGLTETGLVDDETWRALLGEEQYRWGPPPGAIAFDETEFQAVAATTVKTEEKNEEKMANPDHFMAEEDYAPDEYDPFADDDEYTHEPQGPSFEMSKGKRQHKWPILREDDGGMEVHKMQVLLAEQGYDSGEDDMEYWYFGSTTSNALMTFQAVKRLPESGITDIKTWCALLGVEELEDSPAETLARVGDGDYPNDLSRSDSVFLLGEQRYETR